MSKEPYIQYIEPDESTTSFLQSVFPESDQVSGYSKIGVARPKKPSTQPRYIIKVEAFSPAFRTDFYSDAYSAIAPLEITVGTRDKRLIYEEGKGGSAANQSSSDVLNKLQTLFLGAANEMFEPGLESAFEVRLLQIIIIHRDKALDAISDLLSDDKYDVEVRAEAVRVLGRMIFSNMRQQRFRVLIQALNDPSPIIRSAATFALGELREKAAVKYLRDRAKTEKYRSLREDYDQTIEDLSM